MKNGKRDYKREYEEYHADDKQKKNRAKRNSARRELEKEGVVRKNDNKDVDHKRPLSKGGGNSRSNLRAIDASKNRSFARTRNGKMK
jgi:5-methylcytosine-specific restriction endonuclease McrA